MELDKLQFTMEDHEVNLRLDRIIHCRVPEYSRTQIQLWITQKNIFVNGKPTKSSYKVQLGDLVEITIPNLRPISIDKEEIPLDIRYEDDDLLVINKPQGMVVHPANGHHQGTLVNALLAHCKDLSGINGVIRPGIVHRIDKDTSGVLLVAKNDFAHIRLAKQIKDKSAARHYVALVHGELRDIQGVINAPIGRHPTKRKSMAVVADGRPAITHFQVLERFAHYTLVACQLETGRTHQIRVHFAWIGHPIAGDPIYGTL
jgi:23S rRNA pseudouridine1911/1915/1917 synthase